MLVWTQKLKEADRVQFIAGWEEAGGTMAEIKPNVPWCAPWFYVPFIIVNGTNAKEWGRDWWTKCHEEVSNHAEKLHRKRREAAINGPVIFRF